MQEKEMVDDILANVNANLINYTSAITQCDTEAFRNFLIKHRNSDEQFAWQVYEIAKTKGYYVPAAPAGQADIDQVKQACQG